MTDWQSTKSCNTCSSDSGVGGGSAGSVSLTIALKGFGWVEDGKTVRSACKGKQMGLSRGQKDTKSSLGTVCCLKTVQQEPLPKRESCFFSTNRKIPSLLSWSHTSLKCFFKDFLSLSFYRESRVFFFSKLHLTWINCNSVLDESQGSAEPFPSF